MATDRSAATPLRRVATPANGIAGELKRLLLDSQVAWSLGRRGALAEFSWDEGESMFRDALSISTSRGALRIAQGDSRARLFAGENLGHAKGGWSHWLSLCLPKDECAMEGRGTIAELGPDLAALNRESQHAALFDLGIGGPYFRLCVRTDAHALTGALRAAIGQRVLTADALVRAILANNPARVFESRLARIEVLQPIAPMHGRSPEGPHTHLLPELLQGDQADSENAPAGWVAQIVAYPRHPLRDVHGRVKPFDVNAHEAFQRLLEKFGDGDHCAAKRTVAEAVRSGTSPQAFAMEPSQRESVRIALRQLRCIQGDSATLARWQDMYDAR